MHLHEISTMMDDFLKVLILHGFKEKTLKI